MVNVLIGMGIWAIFTGVISAFDGTHVIIWGQYVSGGILFFTALVVSIIDK